MNFNQLEQKVEALEKRLDALSPDKQTIQVDKIKCRSISVSHPENPHSIAINAGNQYTGIWIAGNTDTQSSVAIYTNKNDGAVVGVYGPTKDRSISAIDVCLCYQGEGMIQMVDASNKVFRITGKEEEKKTFWQTYLANI